MITGSCLCGAIHYQVDHDIDQLVFCHCSRCQKESGSAYNAVTIIPGNNFKITQGDHHLKAYDNCETYRQFCGDCGTHLFSVPLKNINLYLLRVGSLNTDIDPLQKTHVYTAYKAHWDIICDNLPAFEEIPT